MKFRFCGELDAPDWILKEIAIISKICNRYGQVRHCADVAKVINQLLGGAVEYDKVLKFVSEANFETSDVRASLAALQFIVSSAARFDCEEAVLATELAQLGMPKEHCDSLAKPYKENKAKLKAKFKDQVLQLHRLDGIDWRVDQILSSDQMKDVSAPVVQLSLRVKSPDGTLKTHSFEASDDKFKVLIAELKAAKTLLDSVQ